jgi:hypothetical protein
MHSLALTQTAMSPHLARVHYYTGQQVSTLTPAFRCVAPPCGAAPLGTVSPGVRRGRVKFTAAKLRYGLSLVHTRHAGPDVP